MPKARTAAVTGEEAAGADDARWKAQPGPQQDFVASEVFEVVYGGARGGGKTDGALGEFALHAREHEANAQGLMVRRTRRALEPTIVRAREIFRPEGAVWSASRSAFEWPSGARLYFRHLARDADADLYQGHAYSRVYVEELTQFPSPIPVNKLKATLRSAAGVRCAFRATCNPGGVGHAWVKARYVDPGPGVIVTETLVDPFNGATVTIDRTFIPARLPDNPALLRNDPTYVARLAQSGSEPLVRAWLSGDWTAVEGAFFDGWSERNIVEPFEIPAGWTRMRAFDWGYASPFSVGWWAVASEEVRVGERVIPRGALIRYREWYGAPKPDAKGAKLTARQIALGILEREAGEKIALSVADPSIFAHHGGPSVGETMREEGLDFRRADNTRVGTLGALSGWDQVRARIAGTNGVPDLVVFSTCRDFIRTVPSLQHDPLRPEDLDTRSEDHIADETRYACLARPLIARPATPPGVDGDVWRRNWGSGRLSRI